MFSSLHTAFSHFLKGKKTFARLILIYFRALFQAFEASLVEDLGDDFQLPITHRPTENLDTDNMEQASEDTQLTSSNVGFRLLQKMGWKGKGLGKEEQGSIVCSVRIHILHWWQQPLTNHDMHVLCN